MTARRQGDVFATPAPRFYSIAPGRPFLTDFTHALRQSLGDHRQFALPDSVIYLPTRRAVRALTHAFVTDAPNARASLLPRIKALGDVDEDEFLTLDGNADDDLELAPAISMSQRRLVLARLVAEKDKIFFDGQRRWAGAIAAADELGKLLDSLYTEEVDPGKFEEIVPEALAAHWRHSLEFLSIIIESWPAYLSEHGLMDPAARRVALIDRQTERWRRTPPAHPVVIAGTTGSTPAVARMMKIVAALPMGAVILPGLDVAASQRIWDAIDEPHPQSGLKALLSSLDLTRDEVAHWPQATSVNPQIDDRSALITVALRPANASDDWRNWAQSALSDATALTGALADVALVEAADEDREAATIALKMRETIEHDKKTAMLVTPDRDLARRVSLKMRRWGVAVDDSAGVPFSASPCGVFLRLTAAWLMDIENPVRLMALLDHPLFGGGLSQTKRRQAAALLDTALRGIRPGGGFTSFKRKVPEDNPAAKHALVLLNGMADILAAWPESTAPFDQRFAAHLSIAEYLASTAADNGAERLWRGEDGDVGAEMLAQLQDGLAQISNDRPEDYADIFTRLIAGAVIRSRGANHPRLSILGPLEARLQNADLVILGGLNEGVWPRDAAIDPFLSRPMRQALGLPSPERRIGLAAHDFAQLSAAPSVMFTRAARSGGKPTKPSRWVVRLKNILEGANMLSAIDQSDAFEHLAHMLDQPAASIAVAAPRPTPPTAARPTDFFVTQIEKLLRDPYAIYARHILRLRKLDRLDEAFDNRHVGNLFHAVLFEYASAPPPDAHDARVAALQKLWDEKAESFGLTQDRRAFWNTPALGAFERLARWDEAHRNLGAPAILEEKGTWRFSVGDTAFSLSARADRIDRRYDDSAHIADYKTASAPTRAQTKTINPQLPLTGIIVQEGGFEEFGSRPVSGFEYVRILQQPGAKAGDTVISGADAASIIDTTRARLLELLAHYHNHETAYLSQPRPQFVDDYGDYDHLARRRERSAIGGAE